MEVGTTATTLTAKLLILNPGEYDLWLMRIEQYFLMTDYSLLVVIKDGSKVLKKTVGTIEQLYEPTSVEEKLDKKNEMKARGTLLMALPNKDQLKFHSYEDSKLLMEAIKKRYGGNKESKKNALIAQDEIRGYDWSYQAEEEHPTNYALMALTSLESSSSLDSEVDSCSKTCLNAYATLKEQYDSLSSDYKKSQFNLVSYKAGLQSVEERLVHYKKNEAVIEKKINILNLKVRLRDNAIVKFTKKLEKAEKEIEMNEQVKSKSVDVVSNVSSSVVKTIDSKVESIDVKNKGVYSTVETKPVKKNSFSPLITKDWISNDEGEVEFEPKVEDKTFRASIKKIKFVKPASEKVEKAHDRKKCYLADYEDYDGGFVSFGDGKGIIYGKGKIKTGTLDYDDVYFWIKREFSVARTPQQNEAVNTACNVLNRALVIKPHNKTPYELIHGRPLQIDFMKPFGCPVTILNTWDYLGKFDEKADEGFLVGFSVVSKAMRVFNKRTRIVEETLNIRFLENAPNVKGNGPYWLFDINSLTISMNYVPVVTGFQSNGITGTKDNIVAGPKDSAVDAEKKATEVNESQVSDNGGQDDQVTRSEFEGILQQERQTKHINNTNSFNTVSLPVNTVGPSFVNAASPSPIMLLELLLVLMHLRNILLNGFLLSKMLSLPHVPIVTLINDTGIFRNAYDDEAVEEEVDMNNVVSSHTIPDVPLTKFLKDHLKDQVEAMQDELLQFKLLNVWTLVDLPKDKWAIGTKWVFRNKKDKRGLVIKNKARLVAQGHTQKEGIDYDEVFAPISKIKAIRLFLAYVSFKDFVVYQMDVKSAFLYEKIQEEVYVYQPPGFEDPDKVYKRIFIYLKGQPKLSLWYPIDSPLDLEDYSDSNYARASLDRKSTTEGCQFLGKRLISWQCKKQTIVANSTTEAEYVGAANKTIYKEWEDRMERAATITSSLEAEQDSDACCFIIIEERVNAVRYNLMLLVLVYDSCVKQFWTTAKVKKVNVQEHIQALVDKQKVINTKESVISDLKFDDAEGTACLLNDTIFEELARISIPTPFNDPLPSGEDSIQLNELMIFCTNLQQHVLDIEEAKTTQAKKIDNLKKRVKKLEKRRKLRPAGLRRLKKVGSKIALVDEAQGRMHDADMFGVDDLEGNEVIVDVREKIVEKEVSTADPVTTAGEVVNAANVEDSAAPTTTKTADVDDELTLAKTLIPIKATKPKVILTAATTVRTAITTLRAKGIFFYKQVQAHIPTVTSSKDKGKAKMIEPEKPLKKKDQIALDKEKLAKQEQAKVADDDTAKLKRFLEIVPKDDDDVAIKATSISSKSPTIVDYKIYKKGKKSYFKIIRADGNSQNYLTFGTMFKNFNKEDLKVLRSIVKEKFKKKRPVDDMDNLLFQTLKTIFEPYVEYIIWKYQQGAVKVNNWKLFYSCGVYCVTTKNMVYYLLVEKMYPFTNSILHQLWLDVRLQVDYEVEMANDLLRLIRRQINEENMEEILKKTQVEVTKGSSKRAGQELEQESAKKQKLAKQEQAKVVDDDIAELKRCLKIVPEDDDNVAIKATPLSSKSSTIVDYKIYKEGKKSYFKIIRADGNSQNYLTFGTIEALVSVYNLFALLMNDLERNGIIFPKVTINTKFLNCLQPEWLKYVTQVCLAKRLTKDSYNDLFDYLQKFEELVNASRAKKLEKSHDPLALVAHTGDVVQNNSEDPFTSAMILLSHAITKRFSNLTNNHLCTSSNTINQAIVQDSKYFMEQMLLAKQDEEGVILTDEHNDFLFDDASQMEEIEELSANVCLMVRIQPANIDSDVGPSFDSAFLSEVQTPSTNYVNPLFAKDNQEQKYPKQPKIINNIIGDDQIDSNIKFDEPDDDVNISSVEDDNNVQQSYKLAQLAKNAYKEAKKQQK
uniref:Uncharacterized protein n=1 Tax=Tanacetum cinerariifolium TaxID=118510 RepID=A0A6L2JHI7_TANCI|nr:hypothetical protein [Tanacetum cinerariifolium]